MEVDAAKPEAQQPPPAATSPASQEAAAASEQPRTAGKAAADNAAPATDAASNPERNELQPGAASPAAEPPAADPAQADAAGAGGPSPSPSPTPGSGDAAAGGAAAARRGSGTAGEELPLSLQRKQRHRRPPAGWEIDAEALMPTKRPKVRPPSPPAACQTASRRPAAPRLCVCGCSCCVHALRLIFARSAALASLRLLRPPVLTADVRYSGPCSPHTHTGSQMRSKQLNALRCAYV